MLIVLNNTTERRAGLGKLGDGGAQEGEGEKRAPQTELGNDIQEPVYCPVFRDIHCTLKTNGRVVLWEDAR